MVRAVTVAIIDPLWNPLPVTAPAPPDRRPPAPSAVAASPILGGGTRRLAGAADRDRPGLADPVLRPGLGRHPAGRAGPAGAGRGRGGDRHERLRLGAPGERRRADRRVRARGDHRRRPCILALATRRRSRSSAIAGSPRSHRPTRAGFARALRADAPAWIVGDRRRAWSSSSSWAATAGTRRPTAGSSGGWNWSDLLVHVSIGSSIAAGNFPPEVPYFAGVPLTYHWFADFHGAITSTVAGVDIIAVYFATSALFAGVLALVVWALAMRLTGASAVATIAAILVCFGGRAGLDPAGRRRHRRRRRRRSTSSAALLLRQHLGRRLAVLQDRLDLRDRASCPTGRRRSGCRGWSRSSCSSSRASAGGRSASCWPGSWPRSSRRSSSSPSRRPTSSSALYVADDRRLARADGLARRRPVPRAGRSSPRRSSSAPSSARATSGRSGSSSAGARRRFDDGPAAVAFFYLTNLGHPVRARGHRRVHRPRDAVRWFLVAWVVALFIVPNVVVVSAVEFDMNKYFQIMWIAVAILAAWLHPSLAAGPVVAVVLVVSALSPVLIAIWHMRSTRRRARACRRRRPRRWIAANTPERSVFVTDAFINSPVDLAGRLRITTFGPYVSNLGYDPAPREADTQGRSTATGPEVAAERMADVRRDVRAVERRASRATARTAPTSPRATGSRRSTTRTGSRSGGCAAVAPARV